MTPSRKCSQEEGVEPRRARRGRARRWTARSPTATAIAVRYARQLTLTVDGEERTYWTTATHVDDALDQIGQRFVVGGGLLDRADRPHIGRDGLEVEILTPKTITLKVGCRRPKKVTTTALDRR